MAMTWNRLDRLVGGNAARNVRARARTLEGRALLFFALPLFMAVGCDSSTVAGEAEPQSISLSPAQASLDEGASLKLQVVAAGRSGWGSGAAGSQTLLTWKSSDPSVATVHNGTVTAVGPGKASISAMTQGGAFAVSEVSVTRTATTLHLRGTTSLEGVVGTQLENELEAEVLSGAGNAVAGIRVQFVVAKGGGVVSPAVAVTDSRGIARSAWTLGPVAGQQRVEVRPEANPALTRSYNATAHAGPAVDFGVLPEDAVLNRGSVLRFEAVARDAYGNVVSKPPVQWSSSNGSVAQVSHDGKVLGVARGEATITATVAGAAMASVGLGAAPALSTGNGNGNGRVKVIDDPGSASIEITSGNGQTGVVGQALGQALEVQLLDGSGSPLRQVEVTWVVASGGGYVSEPRTRTNGQGRTSVTWALGTSVGQQTVEARVSGVGSATFTANAVAGSLTRVDVSPSSGSVGVGESLAFKAVGTDAYGNQVGSDAAQWSVASTSTASVSGSGLATGKNAGQTEVRASISGIEATADLAVTSDSGGDESTTPTPKPGTVTTLSASGYTSTSASLTWTEVDDGTGEPALYSVRYHLHPIGWGWGQATAVLEGTCKSPVVGTGIGKKITCTVDGLSPSTKYDFQLVSYRGSSWDGTIVYGDLSNVATGTTKSSGGETGSGSIEITPSTLTLTAIGNEAQLSATARDASGSTISNPGFTWTSTSPGIVSVTSAGKVKAMAPGIAMIVAAATCCTADTALVEVKQEADQLVVSPTELSLDVGGSVTPSVSVTDSNGNLIDDSTILWEATDASIATVDSNGKITGVKTGVTTVTASSALLWGQVAVEIKQEKSGGGSAAYPNEPSGFTRWLEHDFQRLPDGDASHAGWFSTAYGMNYTIVAEASTPSPRGGDRVLRIRFPAGQPDGSSPGRFFGFDKSGGSSSSTALKEWYVSLWVMFEGNDWEWPPAAQKLWYNGIGKRGVGSKGGMVAVESPGTLTVSGESRRLRFSTRETESAVSLNNTQNVDGSGRFKVGQWNHIEFYGQASTPNVADARMRLWVNGTLVTETIRQNQATPDWDTGFFEFHWAPVFGGSCSSGCPKTRDDYMRIAHVYVSGIPQ